MTVVRTISTSVLLVLLALTSCHKSDSPVVILDGWWNLDYARNACVLGSLTNNKEPVTFPTKQCPVDPEAEVRGFEREFATAFAADRSCHGITLLQFATGQSSNVAKREKAFENQNGWQLMFDFVPDAKEQDWSMVRIGGLKGSAEGRGTPERIAHSVCAIARGAGGSVE